MSESIVSEQGFACRQCGHCCEGAGGIVASGEDLARLCAFLALDAGTFARRFALRRNGKLLIRSEHGRCVFYKEGRGCAVHAAKPDICRAWPYFRGNLVDEESLVLARAYCPGIAAAQPHAAFVREGLRYLRQSGLAGRGGADEAAALQVADLMEVLANTPAKM